MGSNLGDPIGPTSSQGPYKKEAGGSESEELMCQQNRGQSQGLWPLEAGEGKEQSLQKEHSPADTWVLAT